MRSMIAAALALAVWTGTAEAQQIIGRWGCTAYLGNVPFQGTYQLEWWGVNPGGKLGHGNGRIT